MKRVLLVVSSFVPAITADMHRARHLALHLPDFGWDSEVLTPGLIYQRADQIERDSLPLLPAQVPVHSVDTIHPLNRLIKLRSIGWRSFLAMRKTGLDLLKTGRFDLVYFSTTQFVLFCLGPLWKAKTGVPYILDLHDPWYRGKIQYVTSKRKAKFYLSHLLSKHLERYTVPKAAGIVSVSQSYIEDLKRRYAKRNKRLRFLEIPFGASTTELPHPSPETERPESPDRITLTYIGAGSAIMAKSFRKICGLLRAATSANPELRQGLTIQLFGTDLTWVHGQPKFLEAIAAEEGVSSSVIESPGRVSYSKAMRSIYESDGLLILGVDDKGYVPSKLFTYALTGRPLFACLHTDSPANRYFEATPRLGHLVTFEESNPGASSGEIEQFKSFLAECQCGLRLDRAECLASYLAPAMAERHSAFFEICLPARQHSKDL